MLGKLWKVCGSGILIMFGILCLLCLPTLFIYESEMSFQPFLYVYQIEDTLKELFHIRDLTFIVPSGKTYPFLQAIFERYGYSISLVGIAFLVALVLACMLGYFYILGSSLFRKCLKQILLVVESLPDVMIIVMTQVFFIWVYQRAQWMPFTIFAFQEERPYVLPIICLSILPMIQLFRFLIVYMEDEENRPYVELLKGKGLKKSYIIVVHLFRNVMIHVFYHSKSIFLFMISNLFILEYIFHIDGLMKFLLDYGTQNTVISFIIVCLIFIPFYLFFQFLSIFVNRVSNEEVMSG